MAFQQLFTRRWKLETRSYKYCKCKECPFLGEISFYAGDFQLQIDRHLLAMLVSAHSSAVPKQARADRSNLVSAVPADVAPGCARMRKRTSAGGLSEGWARPNLNTAHQSQRWTAANFRDPFWWCRERRSQGYYLYILYVSTTEYPSYFFSYWENASGANDAGSAFTFIYIHLVRVKIDIITVSV